MRTFRPVPVLGVMAVILWGGMSGAALAQTSASRGERGLFGPHLSQTSQSLVLTSSLSTGATNINVDNQAVSPLLNTGNWTSFANGLANGTYQLSRSWFDLDASLGSALRWYPAAHERVRTTIGETGLQLRAPLGDRTSVTGRVDVSYQPVSVATLFPDQFDSTTPASSGLSTDFELFGAIAHYTAREASAEVSRALSSRATVAARFELRRTGAAAGLAAQETRAAAARYSHEILRGLQLQVGYEFRRGNYLGEGTTPRVARTDSIDAGVNFNRALSLSRRTHLSFATGSTVLSDGLHRRFEILGQAELMREIGRTWQVRANYDRRAGFINTFEAPSMNDAVAVAVTGLLSRRVSVSAGGGGTHGDIGFESSNTNSYWSYESRASLGVAVNRIVQTSVSYSRYVYRFDGGLYLPTVFGTHASRQTVQVSLNVWLPVIMTARTPHAAR